MLISSELANYVMLGDYLACASVASSTVPGHDGSGSDKCAALKVVHGTVQAEALIWWDWFSLMKETLFVFPFREGRDHICLPLCPLLDPLKVCVVVPRPDPSSGCRYLLLWLLGCHLLRPMTESVARNCLGSKGDGKIKLLLPGGKSISNDWWEWGTKDKLPLWGNREMLPWGRLSWSLCCVYISVQRCSSLSPVLLESVLPRCCSQEHSWIILHIGLHFKACLKGV